jgi:hypothetical protein
MANEFYRLRTHNWVNGVLKYLDHIFPTLEETLEFGSNYECDNFKIYDCQDRLMHHHQNHRRDHDHRPYA